ncbi:MAG: DUF2442 domain-containing protein [Dehalococcoidia bacterium]
MGTPEVTRVAVPRPYRLKVDFADGTQREVDLAEELEAGIFEALKTPDLFSQAFVDGVGVAWPNGASLSPEFLYHDAKSSAKA